LTTAVRPFGIFRIASTPTTFPLKGHSVRQDAQPPRTIVAPETGHSSRGDSNNEERRGLAESGMAAFGAPQTEADIQVQAVTGRF
jgi:hypothetical protein